MSLFNIDISKEIKTTVSNAIKRLAEENGINCINTQVMVKMSVNEESEDEKETIEYYYVNCEIMLNGAIRKNIEIIDGKQISWLKLRGIKNDFIGKERGIEYMFVAPFLKKAVKIASKEYNIPIEDVCLMFFTAKEDASTIYLALYNNNIFVKQIKEQEIMSYRDYEI